MTQRRPILRSPLTRLTVLALVIGGVIAAWLGARAVAAEHQLNAARSSMAAARAALLDRRVPEATSAIAAAGRHTARARELTSDPVWRLVAGVPWAGRTLAAAAGVAVAADDVTREVLPQALDAAELLAGDGLRRADGAVDVAVVRKAAVPVRRSEERLARIRADVAALPHRRVVGTVDRGRARLQTQLDELADVVDGAGRALEVAPALLGADRPRTYFVLVQQTSETRGTGGLPGGFAVLRAENGRVRVLQSGSNAALKNGPVPVPAGVPKDYVDAYSGNGAFESWQNVNLSPDLPVVARVVAQRWRAQGGGAIDGVIALDAKALSLILKGTAPVTAAGRRLSANDLPRYLGLDQYVGFDNADQLARKDQIADFARVAADRLTRSGSDDALLRGVIAAVRSGHLRMASDDPALRPALSSAQVDGALPGGPAPVAYAVLANAAGSKLDYFLERDVAYQAGPCSQGRRGSTIAVSLVNKAPARGLPSYVTIHRVGDAKEGSTTNEVLLTVYASRGARLQLATLDGQTVPVAAGGSGPHLTYRVEAGLPSWQVQLSLPRTQERVLVLQLVEPATQGAARVPEQPLARPMRRDVNVATCTVRPAD